MNRYDSTVHAQGQAQTIIEPGTGSQVWGLLILTLGASVAILAAGAMYSVAKWGDMRAMNTVLFLACLPWAIIALLLAAAIWQQAWSLIETLTGRDLDGSGDAGIPDKLIIPFRGPAFTVDGVAPDDWKAFIKAICNTGDWTQAKWRGQRMPSGKKCDNEYWTAMTGGLKKIGVIVNSGPRSTGNMTTNDPDEIIGLLGLNETD